MSVPFDLITREPKVVESADLLYAFFVTCIVAVVREGRNEKSRFSVNVKRIEHHWYNLSVI